MSNFVVWKRSHAGRHYWLKGNVLAVQKHKLSLSHVFATFFESKYVEFYVDVPNKTIAIKPVAEASENSYICEKSKLRLGLRSLVSKLNIKSQLYPAYWDDTQKWIIFKYETVDNPHS